MKGETVGGAADVATNGWGGVQTCCCGNSRTGAVVVTDAAASWSRTQTEQIGSLVSAGVSGFAGVPSVGAIALAEPNACATG